MFCSHCGMALQPGYKFCKNCGAAIVIASETQGVTLAAAVAAAAAPAAAGMPPPPPLVAVATYQVAQQQVYYVSQQAAALAHSVHRNHLLQSLRGRIQSLASTENLEGFSLKEMFSEVFKRRSADDVEDYILVGTTKDDPAD